MRSIKFDQLGRKAPAAPPDKPAAPALAAPPAPGVDRTREAKTRPASENDAKVTAGSPKP
jgi:hypothetical protein